MPPLSKMTRTASWILLTLLGALMLIGALGSAQFAYSRGPDQFGSVSMAELTSGDEELVSLLHARRGTAAAYAAGFSVLLLLLVVIPYRRGEVWAWWAVLAGILVTSCLILLRVPFLGVQLGASIGYMQLGVAGVALLLGMGRLRST
jgi:hypothetical protein